ncbi:hypothetical protein HRI_000731500 [Hibiscus trionum]|uniref:DUF7792 domain-containing protein n=1 Tax=Hibiscus trionum TaxID=183268 RepID=A0A9W7LMZ5_HIBTR|nr:hypothetical protein HRI_000731500 [Hibiscus trionum]
MLGWEANKQTQQILDLVSLAEEVCFAADEAKSFKGECDEARRLLIRLSQMLKTLLCCIRSAPTSLYLRPLNCIVAEVKAHFEVTLAIVRKCNRRNLIRRLFTRRNTTRFQELYDRLNACISDMEWLLSIYVPQRGFVWCSTANQKSPMLVVWSCIATVKMGCELEDRVRAAGCLMLLVERNDEYKKIIYEEGGVPPLQKLLKENISLDAQINVAKTLCLLVDDKEREIVIMNQMVPTILDRLSRTSVIWDQIEAADLVAFIAEHNPKLKEYHLIRENVIWRLVSLLSSATANHHTPTSFKLQLKLSCSKALLMLVRRSVPNCTSFTETKGLLCLPMLLATEKDELQYSCLMILREITAIAEWDKDFRHSTFKSSSPASKAVVDELLRVIEESDNTKLQILAIKSVGSLARSFSAKENQVISPLVARLGDTDRLVAMEASIALQKFVCSTNHLCSEHSKSIIEFNGVPLLMKLLLDDRDKMLQSQGLTLICNLAIHDSNNNVLRNAGALTTALQTTGQAIAEEQPELEALVSEAISKLQSNKTEKQQVLDSSAGIKQIITEQSKLFFDFVRRRLKLYLPWIVNLLQESCMKGISGAIRCLKKRRIMKAQCVELGLSLRWAMDSRKRAVMKEIARKLWLVKKIVKSMEKKEIRRKFGYIVHKTRTGSCELFQAQLFLSSNIFVFKFSEFRIR